MSNVKIYAHVDENNQLLGWYADDIYEYDQIPTPHIEVTADVWDSAITSAHNKVNNDGTTEQFVFGTVEEIAVEEQININATAKRLLKDTDWKVLRHMREKALNKTTSLSEAEYIDLENQRDAAAESIVDI